MAVLVGIDEAGYGPLLGPLVVSSAAFSMPEELLKADHWKVLSRAVGREKKGLAGRLVITDSKKAYSRAAGVELTEVLGGQGPSNFARSILKYWNHGRRQENRLDNRFGN